MGQILDFVLHLDRHLGELIVSMGPWIYVLLFAIIFAETGLVFMPFLPGDTLLFAAGMAAAGVLKDKTGAPATLNLPLLLLVLTLAPLAGDTVNYHLGRRFGPRLFSGEDSRFFKRENLVKTQRFFAKHGPKAVIFARWIPVVRTIAPFVAGMGAMEYPKFFRFSFIGAVLWVWICTFAGYLLGSIPVVKNNFHYAMIGLIFVSLVPVGYEFWKERKAAEHEASPDAHGNSAP